MGRGARANANEQTSWRVRVRKRPFNALLKIDMGSFALRACLAQAKQ